MLMKNNYIKISVYDKNVWESSQWSETSGWNGPSLLKLAGIYNKWKSPNGDVYSYSVVTMESSEVFSQLHHRIPAVLENEQLIEVMLLFLLICFHNISYLNNIN